MSAYFDRQLIRQQYQRRFLLKAHAIISIVGIFLFTQMGLGTRRYIPNASFPAEFYFAGLNPVPFLLAIGLGGAFIFHLIRYRNQAAIARGETSRTAHRKRQRRTIFSLHSLLTFGALLTFMALSYDMRRIIIEQDPVWGGERILTINALPVGLFLIILLALLLVIPHGIRLVYVEGLDKALQQAAKQKRKNELTAKQKLENKRQDEQWIVGDDGELLLQNELEQPKLKNKRTV